MVCLDTDILIDFFRNEPETIKKIKDLEGQGVKLSTTSITGFELFKGAFRSKQGDMNELIDIFLNNLKILNFDLMVSKKAAEIFEELRSNGELIDPMDLMIAAIVITNKETLLTRNLKHFSRIKDLQLL